MAPTTLDAFELLETIAQGRTRTVHRARRLDGGGPDRRVVIERGALSEERLAAASRIDVRGVARVLAWGAAPGGGVWYETELLDGMTLEQAVAKGPPPLRVALRAFEAVLEPLAEAHARGLAHGALEAGRIVLARDGPWLLDHGTGSSDEGLAVFTRAPELWRGKAPDASSDLYAVGALLHFACTGRYPFPEDPARAHLVEPAPRLGPPVPIEVDAIVIRLLAKFPASRFESAAQVRRALADARARLERADLPAPSESERRTARATTSARLAIEEASRTARDPGTIRALDKALGALRDMTERVRAAEQARDAALRGHEIERVERAVASDRAAMANAELAEALRALAAAEERAATSERARADAFAEVERHGAALRDLETRALADRQALDELGSAPRTPPPPLDLEGLEAAFAAAESERAARNEAEARAAKSEEALAAALATAASPEPEEVKRVLLDRVEKAEKEREAALSTLAATQTEKSQIEARLLRSMKALSEAMTFVETERRKTGRS
jgi:serine/threonine-protein kinase